MKKAFFALVLVLVVVAPLALADNANNIPAGPVWGHLSDWSSLYRLSPTSGQMLPYRDALPAIGDEGRAVVYVNQFYNADTGDIYWSPGQDELTGLEYDFVIPGGDAYRFNFITGVYDKVNTGGGGIIPEGPPGQFSLYFVAGANGGKIDIYRDTTPDFNTLPNPTPPPTLLPAWRAGPTAWVDNPGATPDDYPLMSDVAADGVTPDPNASMWLTGTYAPLFADLNFDGKRQAGEPDLVWFDQDGDGVFTAGTDLTGVYQISSWTPGGVGSARAWIDFTGGSFIGAIKQDSLGQGIDLSLTVDLDPVAYGSRGLWGTRSSDPTYMEVIPEPSTLGLLGTSLVGLIGFIRRKRA